VNVGRAEDKARRALSCRQAAGSSRSQQAGARDGPPPRRLAPSTANRGHRRRVVRIQEVMPTLDHQKDLQEGGGMNWP
jgi:hypothetical protein